MPSRIAASASSRRAWLASLLAAAARRNSLALIPSLSGIATMPRLPESVGSRVTASQPKILRNPPRLIQSDAGSESAFSRDGITRRLAELGWIEGKTLIVECVTTVGRLNQLPAVARELVSRRPDVLSAASIPLIKALKQATTTIPMEEAARPPPDSALQWAFGHPGVRSVCCQATEPEQ